MVFAAGFLLAPFAEAKPPKPRPPAPSGKIIEVRQTIKLPLHRKAKLAEIFEGLR